MEYLIELLTIERDKYQAAINALMGPTVSLELGPMEVVDTPEREQRLRIERHFQMRQLAQEALRVKAFRAKRRGEK